MKYLLEPMLFAVDENMSEDEFDKYIKNLLDWGEWSKDHSNDIYILSSTEYCLYENNLFPQAGKIKKLIAQYNIDGISFDKVDMVIRKLIRKANKIDELISDDSYYASISITPRETLERRTPSFNEQLFILLWCVFSLGTNNLLDIQDVTLFIKDTNGYLDVDIIFLEEDKDDYVERQGFIKLYSNESIKSYLADGETPIRIWKKIKCKDDLDFGLRVAVFQNQLLENLSEAYENYDINIQDSFYDEFCANNYSDNDKDLRSAILACTYAVTNQNLSLMHDIRKSKCGGSPQFVVNGYGAWRRNSTTSVKIAYWKKKNRFLLADIGEHDFIEPTQEKKMMI